MVCCGQEAVFLSVDVHGKGIYFCHKCGKFPSHLREEAVVEKKLPKKRVEVKKPEVIKDGLW